MISGFDLGHADERAAMGRLLYLIVERNRPATGLMISALVTYLDANDAGTGFAHSPRNSACFPAMPPPRQSWTSGLVR